MKKIAAKDLKPPSYFWTSTLIATSDFKTVEIQIRSHEYRDSILVLAWQINGMADEYGRNTCLGAYACHVDIPVDCGFTQPHKAQKILSTILKDYRGGHFSVKRAIRELGKLGIHRRVWAENYDGVGGFIPRKYKLRATEYLKARELVEV